MTRMTRTALATALLAASLAGALSGCAPLIIGGAAVSAMVAVDRRTPGAQIEDETIELRGGSRVRDAMGDRGHVNVTSYNRQVLLTGEVASEQAKQNAEQIISRVDNVKGTVNELAVLPPSTLGQRSSDALITAKVKASLVDDRELYVGAYKVVTERGVVYLMGRVTQREADKATQIARTIGGVQRVVRIFEIISDDELRRMGSVTPAPVTNASPAPAASAPAPAAVPAPPPPPAVQTAPVTSTPAPAVTPLPPAPRQ
ncbi:BON domain-containing protein [Ramlibacter sp. PS4R-6]|uniref:BON domain-containing protein n=1 Tax=Ramlibacter sp. PS4R-6 TaxID=3133438 RepID=UPI0030AE6443